MFGLQFSQNKLNRLENFRKNSFLILFFYFGFLNTLIESCGQKFCFIDSMFELARNTIYPLKGLFGFVEYSRGIED